MTDERDPMRELFGEVIHTYTRAQALADGSLIDVTETAAEAGFRLPVAVTRTVWLRYCEWPEELGTGQSTEGRLWDVLWLAVWAARTAAEPSARITYTLGVVPVGMSKATWGDDDGDGVLPWVEERLEELGADTPVLFDETEGIDFEAVADTAPDVILASYSGLTQEEYDTLSKIAPVVAYPEVAWGTTYQDMILMNSAALGLADEGEQLVEELDTTVTEAFADHEELAGKNVVFSYLDPNDLSQIGFYTTLDTRPGFLTEYGMGTPEVVEESSAGTDEFYTTVSAERADSFDDVDLIVTYGDQSLARAAQDDPLLSRIPAVEDGAIAMLPDATPLAAAANPTPLSITYNLDEYLDLLAEALA